MIKSDILYLIIYILFFNILKWLVEIINFFIEYFEDLFQFFFVSFDWFFFFSKKEESCFSNYLADRRSYFVQHCKKSY